MIGLKKCLLLVLFGLTAQVAFAEEVYADVQSGLLEVYPAGSITSGAKADAALSLVDQFTASTEARYIDEQRVCYTKFFVTRCLDRAKADHHVTASAINKIGIEANRFKRQARADDSERVLTERKANRAANKQ